MAETEHIPDPTVDQQTPGAERFSSVAALSDAHSSLLQREMTTEGREAYLAEAEALLKRVSATGAILDNPEERYVAQSILNYWLTVLYRTGQTYEGATTLAAYDPHVSIKLEDDRCPYPGVRPFTEEEKKFFFGRQRQINYLLSRLREERLLAIVGPSGSGKTSLVVAGLLPEMKLNDRASEVERYYFPVVTPGSEPLKALLRMVQSDDSSGQGVDSARVNFQNDGQLLDLIHQFTKLPAVIVIDQFHEVFTRANYSDCRAFLRNLHQVIEFSGLPHTVIALMQETDYDAVLRNPENFRKRFDPARVSLPPLSSLELRDAIEKPGSYVGIKFPETIVKALVRDTMSEQTGLPLLQFMLCKLSLAHTKKENLTEVFDGMQNGREALAASAQNFYKQLDLRESVACRRVLKQLVTFDNNFRPSLIARNRSELYLHTESDSRVDSIIEKLVDNQLVRVTRGSVPSQDEIELTHDSLLRSWPDMKKWVAALKSHRKRVFVGKVAAAVIAAAALLILTAYAFGWRREIDKSRELSRLSKQELANERFDRAVLLGLAARQTHENDVSRGTLLKLLHNFQVSPRPERFLSAENFSPEDLTFSSEITGMPKKLAAINSKGKIIIWNLDQQPGSPQTNEVTLAPEGSARHPIVFSPNSKRVATASIDTNEFALLWDTTTGKLDKLTVPGQAGEADAKEPLAGTLAFSPNTKIVFAGGLDGVIWQWDVDNPSAPGTRVFAHTNPIRSIAVNSKGDRLAVGDDDGEVFLLDLTKNRDKKTQITAGHVTEFEGDETVYNLAFNDDSSLLAASRASSESDTATVWRVADRKLLRQFPTGLPSGLLVAFTGEELKGFNTTGVVFTWDIYSDLLADPVYKPLLASETVSFSINGNFVALPSPHLDGAIVWVLPPRELNLDGAVRSLAFKPRIIETEPDTLTVGEESQLSFRMVNLDQQEDPTKTQELYTVKDICYSTDGSKIASALNDGTIRVRDSKSLQEEIRLSRNLTGSTDSIRRIVFDPNDVNRLAALVTRTNVSTNETTDEIVLWDTKKGSQIDFAIGKPSADKFFRISDIVFEPSSSRLVWAADNDKQAKVIVWDLTTNTLVRELPAESEVLCLAFHPTQNVLAAGLANGTIQVWEVDEENAFWLKLKEGSGAVTELAFSPQEGAVLACAHKPTQEVSDLPNLITLWDMANREQLGGSLRGHQGSINSIAFSPDGNILASGSEDKSVRLWGPLNDQLAEGRLCDVIGCRRTYDKLGLNKDSNPLDDDSLFQALYRTIGCQSSVREIHNPDPSVKPNFFFQIYRSVMCES